MHFGKDDDNVVLEEKSWASNKKEELTCYGRCVDRAVGHLPPTWGLAPQLLHMSQLFTRPAHVGASPSFPC